MKNNKSKVAKGILILLTILWILFIWHHSMQNGVVSDGKSLAIIDSIQNAAPDATESAEVSMWESMGISMDTFIRKCAHMFEFFMLAVLVSFAVRNVQNRIWMAQNDGMRLADGTQGKRSKGHKVLGNWAVWAIGISVVVAIIYETIQLYVPGRNGCVRDVFIDVVGAVIGIIAVSVYNRL